MIRLRILAAAAALLASAVIAVPVAQASPGDPNGDQSFFSRIDGKVSGTSDQWIPLAHWGCSQFATGQSFSTVLGTAENQNPQSSQSDIATVLRAGMAAYCPGVAANH
jgi:hypothetical protein